MKLNLGTKLGNAEPQIALSPNGETRTHYPSFYISDVDGLDELPEKGEAKITFRRVSKNVSDRDGKKSVTVELEVESIDFEDSETEKPEKDGDEKETTGAIEQFFGEKEAEQNGVK